MRAAWYRARRLVDDVSEPGAGLFFIVGRGRSGTTLLSRMLSSHRQLEVAPEGFFVMNLRRRYGTGSWDEGRITAFCRDLLVENRMKTWGLDTDAIAVALRREGPDMSYARACELVYRDYARTRGRSDVKLVGDKNPHYGLLVADGIRVFPRARFVYIVRDYRDNILSYKNVPFDVSNPAALAYRWRRYNEEILAVSRRHPQQFLRVRYEDLLADVGSVLGRICEFLGVDFDDKMLAFNEYEGEFYGEGSKWFENLKKPLDASQSEKWRSKMSAEEIREADRICAPIAAELGYAPAEPLDGALLPPRSLAGFAFGWATVTAEKLIFGVAPADLRMRFINTYRARSGRT